MFYSHAILTSREHGVATVWLVATLGSKSSMKTVTRKKILDVDVLKACETIQNPEAPMALRLQGNLLYGVSRVYSQQCGYALTDAQAIRDKVRGVSLVLKDMALDPEAGLARAEQLNLPDDPTFLPELDLSLDLFDYNLPRLDKGGGSSLMSPVTATPRRSGESAPEGEDENEAVLEFSSAGSPFRAGLSASGTGLGLFPGVGSAGNTSGPSLLGEDSGIMDVGWEFDENGDIVDTAQAMRPVTPPRLDEDMTGAIPRPGRTISATGELEQPSGTLQAIQQIGPDGVSDESLNVMGDDEVQVPGGPVLPPHPAVAPEQFPQSHMPHSSFEPYEDGEEEEAPSTEVSAPQRRGRTAKRLGFDHRPGLTNNELRQWNEDYLENMKLASGTKHRYRLVHQAKKNAMQWVLGYGIGNVGRGLGQDHVSAPLQNLSGDALLAALTGRGLVSVTSRKHGRTLSARSIAEEEMRRVRAREGKDDQLGRGASGESQLLPGEAEGVSLGDDEIMDVEAGRNAPASLPEGRSSQMPWDIYSTIRQGSGRTFSSVAAGGISSSIAGAGRGGMEFGPPSSLSRRATRLPTISPLQGRGLQLPLSHRISILSTPEDRRLASMGSSTFRDDDALHDGLGAADMDSNEYALHSPSAITTEIQNPWIAATLDSESRNFLDFLDAQIQARHPSSDPVSSTASENAALSNSALFESLLPPTQHSHIVAAQAFLHILTLASKGLVTVQQDQDWHPDVGFAAIRVAIAVVVED